MMWTFKEVLAVVGVFLIGAGFMCLPGGFGNPKAETSLFVRESQTGAFWQVGLAVAGIGVLVLVIAAIIPARK